MYLRGLGPCELAFRLVEIAAQLACFSLEPGNERTVFRLLPKLLEFFIDRVGGTAGIIDDILRLLARLLGGLFLFLLDLRVILVGFFLLLFCLAAQALGLVSFAFSISCRCWSSCVRTSSKFTSFWLTRLRACFQNGLVDAKALAKWQTHWTCRAHR